MMHQIINFEKQIFISFSKDENIGNWRVFEMIEIINLI